MKRKTNVKDSEGRLKNLMLESIRKKLREKSSEEDIKIKSLDLDDEEEDDNMDDWVNDEDEVEGSTGNSKEIQTHLEAALEAARDLGDEKLVDQIGNTITFYTRTHIVGDKDIDESNLFESKKRRGKLIKGKVKIDESVKNFQKLAGILTEAMDNTGDVDFGDINNPSTSLTPHPTPTQDKSLDINKIKEEIFHMWDNNIDDSRNGIKEFIMGVGTAFKFSYDPKWGRDFDEFMSDVKEYFNEKGITDYKYYNNHSLLVFQLPKKPNSPNIYMTSSSPITKRSVINDIIHLWDDNIIFNDSRNGIEGFNTDVGIKFEFFYDPKWGRDFDEFMSDVKEYFNEKGITEYKYDNNHSTLEIYT